MRNYPLAAALALAMAVPAIAQPTGAPASTMTTNSEKPAPPPRYRSPPQHLNEVEAAHILAITPRPPLNIDCGSARERAVRSDLERAQYRLKCGG